LLEARAWYEERREGLGATFAAAVERAIERIRERPLAYPRVRGETRRAVLRRFPYGVYFQVLEDEIVVLAIMHGRRHPRRWQSRA
jgi:plasmid stabilization system protein ParE